MSDFSSLIQELDDAIASGAPRKKLKLLTLITDLFVAGSSRYSTEQVSLFDEVLLPLSSAIEEKARAKLSRRLAGIDNAPARVVRSLAFDDSIDVAGPVLTSSNQLNDSDLVANARTKSQDHLHAISQRRSLSEAVTDVLVERGDARVVHSVTRNSGARFSSIAFTKLVAQAGHDETLAGLVGARHDLPRHHFLKLLETASASVRAKLEAANPHAAEAVRDVVAEIAEKISGEVRNASQEHASAKAQLGRLRINRKITESDVHAFARLHNFERTAVAFAALGKFPIELVERALLDERPDLALVLARAAECCWSTTKAILLMSASNRALSPLDLDKAMGDFDKLKIETAKQAVDFYRSRRELPAAAASTAA
ncbi:MAG: DUF2336 domain-containing protein [Pseudorhodoplanes sp.]|jgi:uncharacterized protein (DUF2336 family)|nr:DUF2336 domain-containing protein [Pseudorhodoplanes sp.]